MSEELKARIKNYWNKRAADFKNQSIAEMQNERYDEWINLIDKYLPHGKCLKVLDIGTGAGYMAMLMASKGHEVTGVDLCNEMIESAKEATKALGFDINLFQCDAEKLTFEPNTFDVIITRNLTWTLPHVDEDYKLWYSFLKEDGLLINFDADYGQTHFNKAAFLEFQEKQEKLAPKKPNLHGKLSAETLEECDQIKHSLDISKHRRPGWDVELLKNAGFSEVLVKLVLNKNNPRRGGMFGLFAYK